MVDYHDAATYRAWCEEQDRVAREKEKPVEGPPVTFQGPGKYITESESSAKNEKQKHNYFANREKRLHASKVYYQRNKDKIKKRNRNYDLGHRYGINREVFNKMVESQGGRCAICSVYRGSKLHVDHGHFTNKVRGLLCDRCNRGLGYFDERPDILELASLYIKKHKGAT